jgi:hypothetical protein
VVAAVAEVAEVADVVPQVALLRQQVADVVAAAVVRLPQRVPRQRLARLRPQRRLLPFLRFRALTRLQQRVVVVAQVADAAVVDAVVRLRQRRVLQVVVPEEVVEPRLLARRSS